LDTGELLGMRKPQWPQQAARTVLKIAVAASLPIASVSMADRDDIDCHAGVAAYNDAQAAAEILSPSCDEHFPPRIRRCL
jgi:hypothetical protein